MHAFMHIKSSWTHKLLSFEPIWFRISRQPLELSSREVYIYKSAPDWDLDDQLSSLEWWKSLNSTLEVPMGPLFPHIPCVLLLGTEATDSLVPQMIRCWHINLYIHIKFASFVYIIHITRTHIQIYKYIFNERMCIPSGKSRFCARFLRKSCGVNR